MAKEKKVGYEKPDKVWIKPNRLKFVQAVVEGKKIDIHAVNPDGTQGIELDYVIAEKACQLSDQLSPVAVEFNGRKGSPFWFAQFAKGMTVDESGSKDGIVSKEDPGKDEAVKIDENK